MEQRLKISLRFCLSVIFSLMILLTIPSCQGKKMTEMEYDLYVGIAVTKAKIYDSMPAGKGMDFKPSPGFAYLVCRIAIENKSKHSIHLEPSYFSIHTSDERVFLCNEEVSSAQTDFLDSMDLGGLQKVDGILVFNIQKATYYKLVFKTFNREIEKLLTVEGEI